MLFTKFRAQALALPLVLLLVLPSLSFAEQGPRDVIVSAVEELSQALANGQREALKSDPAALNALINRLLEPRFDQNYAARLVLARHWRDADNEQKRRFIDAFYSAMLRRYASGVLEFQEDRVTVLPMRGETDPQRASVNVTVVLDNGKDVPVSYALVNRDDAGWRVYDVTIEGISYIRNFRAELDSEINKTSLNAVIARLEKEASGAKK